MLSIRQVDFGALLIETRESYQYCSFKPVTTKEAPGIVQSFKMKKAKDVFWLSSEHLRFAPSCLYRGLSVLMKRILETGYVHPQLKRGILTPVLLKKDATLLFNYRGITVLSVTGKVLERVYRTE